MSWRKRLSKRSKASVSSLAIIIPSGVSSTTMSLPMREVIVSSSCSELLMNWIFPSSVLADLFNTSVFVGFTAGASVVGGSVCSCGSSVVRFCMFDSPRSLGVTSRILFSPVQKRPARSSASSALWPLKGRMRIFPSCVVVFSASNRSIIVRIEVTSDSVARTKSFMETGSAVTLGP